MREVDGGMFLNEPNIGRIAEVLRCIFNEGVAKECGTAPAATAEPTSTIPTAIPAVRNWTGALGKVVGEDERLV